MSVKIKLNPITEALINYDSIKSKLLNVLTESFILKHNFIKHTGKLTETAVYVNRPKDLIYISLKPTVVLYETSVYNLKTLNTIQTLNRVVNECNIDPLLVYPHIPDENMEVADYIVFYLPGNWTDDKLDSIFENIDKIMTSCGYFLSITPEKVPNENGELEYLILYEPNFPDYRKIWLPEKLHHVTTVQISKKIKSEGFIPGTNDVYKYSPRLYFLEYISSPILMHVIRRYKKEKLYNKETEKLQYADITINTPSDIKFYFDYHMKDINSFFTFDKIDKKYIDNIEIKNIPPMMLLLPLI